MFQEYFSRSDMLAWPVLALLIFVVIFVGVLAYVFLGLRDRKKVDELSNLPFAPESRVGETSDEEIETEGAGRDQAEGLQDGRTR